MLFFIATVIMRILEFASGRLIDIDGFIGPEKKKKKRRKKSRTRPKGLSVGRGMTTVDELSVSPASDCNSNNVDVSYNSTASDAEFIQDNSDYQWFTEYGYSRDVHQPQSVLSSGYDELARDLDSQLALVDMEDYSAQEILSTLPAMCCTDMQSERQGEMFASVSGSLMVKYDFDSSISPHSSSQEDESVSMSEEPLFSPVREAPLPCTNYSVDSLDCDCEDLVLTCRATNKHNYTIAFHGSTTMHDTTTDNQGEDSVCSSESEKKDSGNGGGRGMATSESPTMTWSKMRRMPARHRHRSKTISLPDLAPAPQPLSNSLAVIADGVNETNSQVGCVKLYDVQKSGSLTSESLINPTASFTKQENFSLLRLFIAQRTQETAQSNDNDNRTEVRNNNGSSGGGEWGAEWTGYEDSLVKPGTETDSSSVERISSECKSDSVCTCSMSTSSHKFNVNNNNSFEREPVKKHNVKVGTSTSDLSSATNSSSGAVNTVRPVSRCPVHCMDRSMQTSHHIVHQSSKKKQEASGSGSPVYVLYPNYTLPDLGFLREQRLDIGEVLLAPMRRSPTSPGPTPPRPVASHHRVSAADIERLKKKGFGHIMDWSSLMPLLPNECWSLLADVPQVRQHAHARFDRTYRPRFTPTPTKELHTEGRAKTSSESGCSEGTSGYRGSSTLLTESTETKQSNPLFVYNYSSTENQNQPKMRAKSDSNHNTDKEKRFSMLEFPDSILDDVFERDSICLKRKSLPAHVQNSKGEKERWDWDGRDIGRERSISPPARHALRLDQLLGTVDATSSLEAVDWRPSDVIHLRNQVSRYLSENSKKNVSFAKRAEEHQRTPPNSPANQKNYQVKQASINSEFYLGRDDKRLKERTELSENKKELVEGVTSAVDKVMAAASAQEDIAALALGALCPALYALMSDGLKPNLDTPFGPIANSVWQVVEASAHQGLVTKALNDLVMKLNSEDVLSEGLVKFNAFIFGLLNVGGVEAWVSYIRTRESVLRKHYRADGLLLTASQGHAPTRALTDYLIARLKPLSDIKFNLDLLYETRLLHSSLLQLSRIPVSPTGGLDVNNDSLLVRKIVQSLRSCGLTSGSSASCESTDISEGSSAWRGRPRSCVERVEGDSGSVSAGSRKRWSGVAGGKLAVAYECLAEAQTSALPTPASPATENPPGGKFRTLQRKWELLSNKTTLRSPDLSPVKSSVSSSGSGGKSRIPRPVASPVRASARLPGGASLPGGATPTRVARGRARADGPPAAHAGRPASLPQSRGPSATSHAASAQRRAASSSSSRPVPTTTRRPKPPQPYYNRFVVTLCHRLATDSGHLAFAEGEKLRLVLEVDDTWLLCCRGDAKGLVPRSAVI